MKLLIELAYANKVPIETIPKITFQKKYRNHNHQGVIGIFSTIKTLELKELIKQAFKKSSSPSLAALDSIQDPHNLGAIIRSAETMGIHGIILSKNRSSAINETVAKCSSGAIEHLTISCITNLTRGIEQLKEAGFWIAGIAPDGDIPCYQYKFEAPIVLIIGGSLSVINKYSFFKNNQIRVFISCLLMIYIGFSTYTMIPIRAIQNPNINENSPDTIDRALAYMNRDCLLYTSDAADE
mgnify:CR=1 FL=1